MRRLLAVLLLLAPSIALADDNIARMRYKKQRALERVTARHEAQLPPDMRLPDGSPNRSHPEYQARKDAWQADVNQTRAHYDGTDTRAATFERARAQAGLGDDQVQNTGGKPKGLGSDMDYTAKSHEAGEQFIQQLKKENPSLRVEEDALRYRLPEQDVVVWKTPKARETAGSSSHEAMQRLKAQPHQDTFPTAGGMHSTSGGKLGVEDAAGAVGANLRKAADAGLDGPPADMNLQMTAKSTNKAMQAAGTDTRNPKLTGKLEQLRNHKTADEALDTFGASPEHKQAELGKLQQEMQGEMATAYDKAGQKSKELDARRARQAQELAAAGDLDGAAKVRQQQIEVRVSNEVNLQELARDQPGLVKKVTGLDPDSVPGREKLIDRSAKMTKLAGDEAYPPGTKPSASAPVSPHSRPVDAAQKWGGRAMTGLDALGGGIGGAEEELEASIKEGRSASKARAATNAVKNTLWEATGIPMVQRSVERAGQLRDEELAAADARYGMDGHSGALARMKALGRMAKETAGIDTASQLAEEEIRHEEEQARLQGREPSYTRSSLNGVARTIGSAVGLSKIAEFSQTDWPAKAERASQERFERHWANARAREGLEKVKAIQGDIEEALATFDPYNPAHRERFGELVSRYGAARQSIARAGEFLRKQAGPQDEGVQAIYDTARSLPEPDALSRILEEYDPIRDAQELVRAEAQVQPPARASEPYTVEPAQEAQAAQPVQDPDAWTAVSGPETISAEAAHPQPQPEIMQEAWVSPPAPVVGRETVYQPPQSGFDQQAAQGLIGGLIGIANTAIAEQNNAGGGWTPPAQPASGGWGSPAAADCSRNFYMGMGGPVCQCDGYGWSTSSNACVAGAGSAGGGGQPAGFGGFPDAPQTQSAPAAVPVYTPAPAPSRETCEEQYARTGGVNTCAPKNPVYLP